jgi:chromosome segregation ATPase
MESNDLTIEILKGIRDEIRETNLRIDGLRDETREGTCGLREEVRAGLADVRGEVAEVSRRVVESEIRTATAITDLAGTVREMTSVLRSQHDLRPRIERCERDIDDLKRRLTD